MPVYLYKKTRQPNGSIRLVDLNPNKESLYLIEQANEIARREIANGTDPKDLLAESELSFGYRVRETTTWEWRDNGFSRVGTRSNWTGD